MKKIILSIVALVILAGGGAYYYFNIYSEQMNEADYTMSVIEAEAEISVALDEIMTCKGFAMMNQPKEKVQKCYSQYFEKNDEYSKSHIAQEEYFKRAKSSEKFKHSRASKVIMKKIGMSQDALFYVNSWLKKN